LNQQQLTGIACRRVFTPGYMLDNIYIEFDGPRIGVMGDFASSWIPAGAYNAREDDLIVIPGMIDVHVHGGGGSDFLDRTAESIRAISANAARGGATSLVATTTIPVDDEELESFEHFVHLIRTTPPPGARMIGIHLEGPFLNIERRGGFGVRFIQPIDLRKCERILSICEDALLKITMAPEIEHAEELVHLFHENSKTHVEISLGHSTASYELAQKFFRFERVRQVTHAFNAMDQFHHRSPNLIGAALTDENVWLEMIPDGCHLTGPAIQLLHRMKGPKRLMVVTDGTAATGTTPGTKIRSVGGVTEVKDGAVRLENGALAGSNMDMAQALASTQKLGCVPFEQALEMCTMTPALSVHVENEIGSIDPRKRADFCVLRTDGSVAATIRDGILVYAGQ
jgi:N-acetylglucosamine-6-phosphate deacetylase